MTVEERLRDTLKTRAEAVRVDDDAWARITAGLDQRPRDRTRPLFAAVAFAAALVLIVVGLAVAGRGNRSVKVTGPTEVSTHARLVLLHTTTQPTAEIVDVDTGARRTVPIAGLVPGPLGDPNAFVVGDAIIFKQANAVHALPVTLDGPARTLGFANLVYPSATPNKLWLISHVDTATGTDTTAREIDTSCTDTTSERVLLLGFTPVAAVDGGLVGTLSDGSVAVWDASTSALRPLGTNGHVVAAHGPTVAWADTDSLHLTLPSGVLNVKAPSGGYGIGSFSPGGRTLVAVAAVGSGADLLSVDTLTRRPLRVKGFNLLPENGYTLLGWSADGDTFFFMVSSAKGTSNRLYMYRRATNTVTKTTRVFGRYDSAVIVPG